MEFPDYSGIFKPGSGFNAKDSWQTGFDNRGSDPFGVQGGSGNKFGEGMRMAGSALEKWGKNRDNDFGYYGNRGGGGGMSGGGVQSSGDFTVIYPQQQQPYTIQGSKGFGGALGTLAGIGASFIPGLGPGIAAAMPAIGGSVGSFF